MEGPPQPENKESKEQELQAKTESLKGGLKEVEVELRDMPEAHVDKFLREYDEKKKKMIFEERKKGVSKEKTLDELLDMIVKLADIDQLVFYYNQIFRVNRCIFDLK